MMRTHNQKTRSALKIYKKKAKRTKGGKEEENRRIGRRKREFGKR